MAVVGQIVPEGQQNKEGFHALRRTTEGLLYYTKIDKDSTESIDVEAGTPSDKRGNEQLPSTGSYVEENLEFSSIQYFTGDGSTLTFTLSTPILDSSRIAVYVNGVQQNHSEVWTFASNVVTFVIAPFSNAQIAVGFINKKYKNNASDFYHQYRFEDGDATYFISDDGYFVKRENRSRGATALTSDDFSTAEGSTYSVRSTTWQSAS